MVRRLGLYTFTVEDLGSIPCRGIKIPPGTRYGQKTIQKKKEILPFVTTWMNLEGTVLGERHQTENHKGTSLLVQWLKPCAPSTGGWSLIPGRGIRSHMPQLSLSPAK